MLDFSFSELLLCFIVALVVLGPERLPAVARAVGRWTGRARSYVRNLSSELEKEAQFSELKRQLEEARREVQQQSQNLHTQVRKLADEVKPSAELGLKQPDPKPPDHG